MSGQWPSPSALVTPSSEGSCFGVTPAIYMGSADPTAGCAGPASSTEAAGVDLGHLGARPARASNVHKSGTLLVLAGVDVAIRGAGPGRSGAEGEDAA